MKPVKVLNNRTFSGSVTVNSWSLRHGDDEDEDTGTEAEAEPGGGSRRHQPEG
jgi:hypothetical protein